jgi:hypothetical protein
VQQLTFNRNECTGPSYTSKEENIDIHCLALIHITGFLNNHYQGHKIIKIKLLYLAKSMIFLKCASTRKKKVVSDILIETQFILLGVG